LNVRQILVSIEDINLLDWLDSQTLFPKVYWQSRDNQLRVAGVGSALISTKIPILPKGSPLRFFGGRSFCQKTWGSFPSCYFFVPLIELEQKNNQSHLIFNIINDSLPPQPQPTTALSITPYQWIHRLNSIDQNRWEIEIKAYLELIKKQTLQKIVCARQTTLTATKMINPIEILKQLKESSQNVTLFGFQMNKEEAFIGATPEKLYERNSNQIICDILAATAPLGHSEALKQLKEKREFEYVKRFIKKTLSPLSTQITLEQDRVIHTGSVHHLYNRLLATLNNNKTDRHLIERLHPTPAMAGLPIKQALQFLAEKENFIRGWYAAPIGWIRDQAADICVGIRSAYIHKERMHLFSAAGIVEGSVPLKEWEELESKIQPFLTIGEK